MILRAILLDGTQLRWLATDSGSLPFGMVDSQSLREGVEGALSSLLGSPVRLLFTPYRTENEAIFVVEWLEAGAVLPADLHWSADEAPLSGREREAIVHACQPHPLRVPWAYPGWLNEALAWLEEALGSPVLQVIPVRSWSLSCVFRAQLRSGWVYFKATAPQPLFCNEPQVTLRLAELFPGSVPKPLALEPTRLWMALAPFEGVLREHPERGGSAEAMALLGGLQRALLDQPEPLAGLGLVDRRLSHLAQEIPALLEDRAVAPELDEKTWAALQDQNWVETLGRCSELPNTLVHGDPHTGNVAVTAAGLQLFDWSDASLSIPFMDLLDPLFSEDPGEGPRLMGALNTTLGLAASWRELAPVIALHHAVSYRHILLNSEPCVAHESGNIIGHLLIKSLDYLRNAEKHT